jgi:hypothetical protein
MMFRRPFGSDRSPRRNGVQPVSATPAAVFCERWHGREHRPSGVISEAAARRRNGRGRPYLVVLGDQRRPGALIEVNWSLDFLGTWFLDDMRRRNLKYSFTRVDAKTLFLEQIMLWEYPDDAVRDLHTATRVTTLTYNQDGIVHEAIDDSVAGTEEVISRCDVALDINWEQVPEFGDWSRVARWDRESC